MHGVIISEWAMCDECEEEYHSDGKCSKWAREHAEKTGHPVTVNKAIHYMKEN